MRIERFLNWIQNRLLNYPDISFTTVKMFIDKFFDCLSEKEKERWKIHIQMIKEFTSKQITLDTIVLDNKINNLNNELDLLKQDDIE